MRSLTPPRFVEAGGAADAVARFAAWFRGAEQIELAASTCDEVSDRVHVSYRLRLKEPGDVWRLCEQHLSCTPDGDRIASLDLLCSGFRPEQPRAD